MANIDSYVDEVFNYVNATWPTEKSTKQTLKIHFTKPGIKLEGKVMVSFSTHSDKVNVRVAYYDYWNVKKDFIVIRDSSPAITGAQIINFISEKSAELENGNRESEDFRQALFNRLTELGFTRDCDSKYMSAYQGNGLSLRFQFEDDSGFRLTVTRTRKKSAGNKNFLVDAKADQKPMWLRIVEETVNLVLHDPSLQ